jgi:decaprenylphospho-beta-D-ribofuranose 2-oxidase
MVATGWGAPVKLSRHLPMVVGQVELSAAGWANYPRATSFLLRPERVGVLPQMLTALPESLTLIARGSGLAYGDAAINEAGFLLSMSRLDKFLGFDRVNGIVRCQAGTRLADILRVALPAGWFLPVTPGTSRATVGGCIACDVHGRNHHHAGSFANHVRTVTLLDPRGGATTCSRTERTDLFWATVGGMGLTGIILDATLDLMPVESSWVLARNVITRDLDDTLRLLADTKGATYSVAWIDATAKAQHRGRGMLMLGEHAPRDQIPRHARDHPPRFYQSVGARVPAGVPGVLGGWFLACFLNACIYRRYVGANSAERAVPLATYLYPLDMVQNWNRLYGKRGFIEYQVIVPEAAAAQLIRGMLDALTAASVPSFLTSMKQMGSGNQAPLSFPMQGIAFSIDLPVEANVFALLDSFDEKIAAAGGRLYLAKDARCRPEVIDVFYPRRREWSRIVARQDARGRLSSGLSRRLHLRAA